MTTERELPLRGRRVVVVGGGGGGVGHAISIASARAGASVAVVDARGAAATATAEQITAEGVGRAVPLVADVRDGGDIDRAVAAACAAFGGLDGVVTSLGGLMAFDVPFVRLHEFTDEDWDTVFDLNIRYVFRVVRAAIPIFVEQGTGGALVTVGSDGGTAGHGSPLTAAYGAAKAGLAHLTKTLAVEYGRDGIRCNMVSPGPTATTSVAGVASSISQRMDELIPLGRRGSPENVADAVVFMLSDLAAHVNGQILGVDGGLSVQRPMPSFAGIHDRT